MTKVLIPGRHLITSAFMVEYLESLLKNGIQKDDVLGEWSGKNKISHIIVPITSANQRGSRYNPVPLYARVIGLERTLAQFRNTYGVRITFIPVPHITQSEHFAATTLKYVEAHINESISPESALIWCSTKPVFTQYQKLGFSILPAEFDTATDTYKTLPPNDILKALVATRGDYVHIPEYQYLSEATKTLWHDMSEIPEHIIRLWNDPLLSIPVRLLQNETTQPIPWV